MPGAAAASPEQTAHAEDLLTRARGYTAPAPVTNPSMRDFYEDWGTVARTRGSIFRREATESPELATLVGRLPIAGVGFRRWWAGHRIHEQDRTCHRCADRFTPSQ